MGVENDVLGVAIEVHIDVNANIDKVHVESLDINGVNIVESLKAFRSLHLVVV